MFTGASEHIQATTDDNHHTMTHKHYHQHTTTATLIVSKHWTTTYGPMWSHPFAPFTPLESLTEHRGAAS